MWMQEWNKTKIGEIVEVLESDLRIIKGCVEKKFKKEGYVEVVNQDDGTHLRISEDSVFREGFLMEGWKRIVEVIKKVKNKGNDISQMLGNLVENDSMHVNDFADWMQGFGNKMKSSFRDVIPYILHHQKLIDVTSKLIHYEKFITHQDIKKHLTMTAPKSISPNFSKLENEIRDVLHLAANNGIEPQFFFESFDTDFSGRVTVDEFLMGMKDIGLEIDPAILIELLRFRGYDEIENTQSSLQYDRFLQMMTSTPQKETSTAFEESTHVATQSSKSKSKSKSKKKKVSSTRTQENTATKTEEDANTKTETKTPESVMAKVQELVKDARRKGVNILEYLRNTDVNFQGTLSANEFKAGLKIVGFDGSEVEIDMLKQVLNNSNHKSDRIAYQGLVSHLENGEQSKVPEIIKGIRLQFLLNRSIAATNENSLEEVLRKITADGATKHVTRKNLVDALHSCDIPVSTDDMHVLLNYWDPQVSGAVDISAVVNELQPADEVDDLYNAMNHTHKKLVSKGATRKKLLERCIQFDPRHQQCITRHEFETVLASFDIEIPKHVFEKFANLFDQKADGRIWYRKYIDVAVKLLESKQHDEKLKSEKSSSVSMKDRVEHLQVDIQEFVQSAARMHVPVLELLESKDSDNTGKLTVDMFLAALQQLGFVCNEDEFVLLMQKTMKVVDPTQYHDITLTSCVNFNAIVSYWRTGSTGVAEKPPKATSKPRAIDHSVAHKAKSEDIEKPLASWQDIFSERRGLKSKVEAESAVKSIMALILKKTELEISSKGAIWQQVRQNIAGRINNSTFIQRNIAIIDNMSKESTKSRELTTTDQLTKKDTKTMDASEKAFVAQAENLHAIEEAASKIVEEQQARAEHLAHTNKLNNMDQNSLAVALQKLNHEVSFTRTRAVRFLESIGLARFGTQLIANTDHRQDEERFHFPLRDECSMKDVLGTSSAIVDRKIKRELISLLKDGLDSWMVGTKEDSDPELWDSKRTKSYLAQFGDAYATWASQHHLDGETLVELSSEELFEDVGTRDEVAAQKIAFQIRYLQIYAKHQPQIHEQNQVCSSVQIGQLSVDRPSLAPLKSWSITDVATFVNQLEIVSDSFMKFGIDGATLIELSDEDMMSELQLGPFQRFQLKAAIEAVQQPAYVHLGIGPYMNARLEALHGLPVSSNSEYCTISPGSDYGMRVHVSGALTKGLKIIWRAMKLQHDSEHNTAISEADNQQTESKRFSKFLVQLSKGKSIVKAIQKKFDRSDTGRVSMEDFKSVLSEFGYNVANHEQFHEAIHVYDQEANDDSLDYRKIFSVQIETSTNLPRFEANLSDDGLVFSPDGTKVSLLTATQLKASIVSIEKQHKGEISSRSAMLQARLSDNMYRVKYVDNGAKECVPRSRINENVPGSLDIDCDVRLAVTNAKYATGIHEWSVRVRNVGEDAAVGVAIPFQDKQAFVGLSQAGTLVLRGFGDIGAVRIAKKSVLNHIGFEPEDVLYMKLDNGKRKLHISKRTGTQRRMALLGSLCFDLRDVGNTVDHATLASVATFVADRQSLIRSKCCPGPFASSDNIVKCLLDLGYDKASPAQVGELINSIFPDPLGNGGVPTALFLDTNTWMDRLHQYITLADVYPVPACQLGSVGDCFVMERNEDESEEPDTIDIGTQVKVRYGGGTVYYSGEIIGKEVAGNGDITYSVMYEDGEVEEHILPDNVEVTRLKQAEKVQPREKLVVKFYSRILSYDIPPGDPTPYMDQVPKRGQSFCNISQMRLRDTFNKRVNDTHRVNWRDTLQADHFIFSANHAQAQLNDQKDQPIDEFDKEWSYMGSVNVDEQPNIVNGTSGIPFTIRLSSREPTSTYYRVGVMAIVGKETPSGAFRVVDVPVNPIDAISSKSMNASRVGGGFDFDIIGSMAKFSDSVLTTSRYFLLSGPIITEATAAKMAPRKRNRPSKPLIANRRPSIQNTAATPRAISDIPIQVVTKATKISKKTTKTSSKQRTSKTALNVTKDTQKTRELPQIMNIPPATDDTDEGAIVVSTTKSVSNQEEQHQPYACQPSEIQQPFVYQSSEPQSINEVEDDAPFDHDYKIVVDRWIRDMNFNVYGDPMDTTYDTKSPLLDQQGNRIMKRHVYIKNNHSSEPWLVVAERKGWLPTETELGAIESWLEQPTDSNYLPESVSPHQTFFESLVEMYPHKPWLNKRQPVARTATTPKARGEVSTESNISIQALRESKGISHVNPSTKIETNENVNNAAQAAMEFEREEELRRKQLLQQAKRRRQGIDKLESSVFSVAESQRQ